MTTFRIILSLIALVYVAYIWQISWLTTQQPRRNAEASRRRLRKILKPIFPDSTTHAPAPRFQNSRSVVGARVCGLRSGAPLRPTRPTNIE